MPLDCVFKPSDRNNKPLSDTTILHHHRLISSILTSAVQWQVILSNPCDRVKPPRVERKEAHYLDDEQTAHMFSCLKKEPYQYQAMITVLVYTGMRRGELFGLKWNDIDFKNKLINIQRTRLYLPGTGSFEDSTKTYSSKRIIKTPDAAIDALKLYRSQKEFDKIKLGSKWKDTEYIFTAWDGAPLHPDTLSGWFHSFVKRCNLPDVCIHSCGIQTQRC